VLTTLPTWDEKYQKKVHQTKVIKRKDVRNISAKNSHQTSAYPTRSNHNSRLNHLKEKASKQRLTTIW